MPKERQGILGNGKFADSYDKKLCRINVLRRNMFGNLPMSIYPSDFKS